MDVLSWVFPVMHQRFLLWWEGLVREENASELALFLDVSVRTLSARCLEDLGQDVPAKLTHINVFKVHLGYFEINLKIE